MSGEDKVVPARLRASSGVLIALLLGASVASARDQQATPATPIPPDTYEYFVAAGDVLKIAVWREPDLTAEVFVRLDGRITVPLVGDIQASGRTTEQLAIEIRTKLQAFLEVPQVTVTVAQATSARFFVIGEVTTSGAFPLTGRTTVLQALALAGGFREFAKRDRIMIIRERAGMSQAITFNFRDVEGGINLEQNIALHAGDVLIVP